LTSKEIQTFITKVLKEKWDSLKISAFLGKSFSEEERRAIMDYIPLVNKSREKFNTDSFLLCDRLALEQSTAYDISEWKAKLWPSFGSVHDLCCGMGGDSFFIPNSLELTGIDMSEERLQMYAYNMQALNKKANILKADVRNLKLSIPNAIADFFTIDPARRKLESENQRQFENLTPTLQEVLEIAKSYKGGMVKLPPGYPIDDVPFDAEIIYLGSRQDCRECLILLGELVQNPGKIRTVILTKNDTFEFISTSKRPDFEKEQNLEEGTLKNYLAEPCPLFVRSRIFTQFAREWNATILSKGIAYLSCDEPIHHIGFSSFEILDSVPLGTSAVKNMLKKHGIGKLTLKKRGVEIIPEEEIKRLKPKGKNEGVLFYTRIAGEKTALLTKRISGSNAHEC
jgi:SAM-dependent methyltransferase